MMRRFDLIHPPDNDPMFPHHWLATLRPNPGEDRFAYRQAEQTLVREAARWCFDQLGDDVYSSGGEPMDYPRLNFDAQWRLVGRVFSFSVETDAIMFKVRWG
ncbi:MAG: hypothetical protein EOP83_05080 [Verrucomicrobiaceae bacterium]|nr:MAG: hypothetical protein EOP83_05080 [Verrucomicrobiaceae bacterium]